MHSFFSFCFPVGMQVDGSLVPTFPTCHILLGKVDEYSSPAREEGLKKMKGLRWGAEESWLGTEFIAWEGRYEDWEMVRIDGVRYLGQKD